MVRCKLAADITFGETMEGPIRIQATHATANFDCGLPALNEWLQKHAWSSERSNATRTFVVLEGNEIIAYYSVCFGSVKSAEAPARMSQGQGQYDIGVLVLARLAVSKNWQGRGLGAGLLKEALMKAVSALEYGGLRGVLVHAKDDEGANFYQRFQFERFSEHPLTLSLLMKDIKAVLKLPKN
jgi:predicted N-acetyltransferase YhbS